MHILGCVPAVVNFQVVSGVCVWSYLMLLPLSLACKSPKISNPDYCLYERELWNLGGSLMGPLLVLWCRGNGSFVLGGSALKT